MLISDSKKLPPNTEVSYVWYNKKIFNVDPTTIERLKLKMVKNAGNAENI